MAGQRWLSMCLALSFLAVAAGFAALPDEYRSFLQFQQDFGIEYDDETERQYRYQVFVQNLKEIERLNSLHQGASFGVGPFSAMTYEEFGQTVLMKQKFDARTGQQYAKTLPDTAPKTIDWRQQKVVSKVKNQGQCGSCWAFATTAAVESQLAIKRKERLLLSEQQLLDCVTNNYGCTGGYLDTAYRYMGYYGQVTEDEYAYQAVQLNCSDPTQDKHLKIDGFYDIVGGEDSIAAFVAEHGPVSFSIMCPKEMMHYKSGVFSVPDCKATNVGWHAMAIVGYDEDSWLIKNSWGEKWGEQGYVRFKRGIALCELDSGAGGPIFN